MVSFWSLPNAAKVGFQKTWGKTSKAFGISSNTARDPSDPEEWKKFIHRLDLYFEDDANPGAVGTGFFLNVPGTTQDVLVTAGHNLIRPPQNPDESPKRVSKIGIRLEEGTIIVTEGDCIKISEPYQSEQSPKTVPFDFGLILVDRPIINGKPQPRPAFGFNIVLADSDLSTKEPGCILTAQVGGYAGNNNNTPTPSYGHGNGNFLKAEGTGDNEDRQIFYSAGIEQGMGGGPIWVNYNGEIVVVGINNGENQGEHNIGVRLERRTMEDIFTLVGYNVEDFNEIKTDKTVGRINGSDLYLQLGPTRPTPAADSALLAHARLGTGRRYNLTSFSIVPARATSFASNPQWSYILIHRFSTDNKTRFLHFNTDPSASPRQITGVEKLDSACLVRLECEMPDKMFNQKNPFKIIISPNHPNGGTETYKLTLSPENIPPEHNSFGLPLESLGLFVRAGRHKVNSKEYEWFST